MTGAGLKSTGTKGALTHISTHTHPHTYRGAHTQRLGGAWANRHAGKSPGTVLSLTSLKQTMAPWNKGLCAQSQRAPLATLSVYLSLCLTHTQALSRARARAHHFLGGYTLRLAAPSGGDQLCSYELSPVNMEQRTLLGKHERTLAVYFWRWLSLIYPTAKPRSQLVMRVLFKARLNPHRSPFNNGTIWMRSCIFSDFSYFHWSPVCASPSWFDWIKVTHPGKRLVWLKMPSPHISYDYTKNLVIFRI